MVLAINTSGVWQWSSIAEGSANDIATGISVDDNGMINVIGWSSSDSIAFDANIVSGYGLNANIKTFIAQLDTNGNWQWADLTKGHVEYHQSIVTASNNDVFSVGTWHSYNNNNYFEFNDQRMIVDYNLGKLGYLLQLDNSSTVQTLQNIGEKECQSTCSAAQQYAYDIAYSQPIGSLFIAGKFSSANIILGSSNLSYATSSTFDVYVAKYLEEDNDLDNDGIPNGNDLCATGYNNWLSNSTTDWDGDGCHDALEDSDDDNDGVIDNIDICPQTTLGSLVNADGCIDSDGDSITDSLDSCPQGTTSWTSNATTDYDSDGCIDTDVWTSVEAVSYNFKDHIVDDEGNTYYVGGLSGSLTSWQSHINLIWRYRRLGC